MKNVYDNCLIQAPDGTPVSRCRRKRLDWYISRGLATLVDENTIRLHKKPSGDCHVKEAVEIKHNVCVTCGSSKKLNIHHVVPYCFRNALPLEWRASSALFHDTVALCEKCHGSYERYASKLKDSLAKKFNISVHGYDTYVDGRRTSIRSYARTLLNIPTSYKKRKKKKHYDPPPAKKEEMVKRITDFLGHVPSHEELLKMTEWSSVVKGPNFIPFGKYIVDQFEDLGELVLMWRKHFIDTMKPQFMPSYWKLDRLPTEEETEHLLRELKDDPKELRWRFRGETSIG